MPWPLSRWILLKCAFSLNNLPEDLSTCFGGWINRSPIEYKKLVLVSISAMFWDLWIGRNDITSIRKDNFNSMSVIKQMAGSKPHKDVYYRLYAINFDHVIYVAEAGLG